MCFFAVLTACGGGGSGSGGNSATPTTPTVATPQTYNLVYGGSAVAGLMTIFQNPEYFFAFNDDRTLFVVSESGITVSSLLTVEVAVEHGLYLEESGDQSRDLRTVISRTVNASVANAYGIAAGSTVRQTVYVADFQFYNCSGGYQVNNIAPDVTTAATLEMYCHDHPVTGNRVLANLTLWKVTTDLLPICARDRNGINCRWNGLNRTVIMAFPDQTYRRDNGDCQSAPFYAADNCQSENAVDVGNFAAFVSGLDGNGYRQFGVRHRFDGDDWNAAAMVSHAKGGEFLDTWWGRFRLEHSIFDDAAAFAEYESGITSLRQNGFMFADIPISGGRAGFRLGDFTASFGRPMHYKGKGKNAAAVHWQATKQTEFSFRNHNDNAEVQWQWRRRF